MAKRSTKRRSRSSRSSRRSGRGGRTTKVYKKKKKSGKKRKSKKGYQRSRVTRVRRRWPGFTAARPRHDHYEVLHQAWKRGRGDWYIMGFPSSLTEAKKLAQRSGRPGDFAIRKVVDGIPQPGTWRGSAVRVRTFSVG